ncbi:hypothetical protein GGX14DRAFT_558678 [Mycena pura]|uniref:Uncharacterized protein n=1 Tax=Mycena pura TaxID=153505 RepID=A0AAD6YLJ1_9AGAR|nr:hypothetical protein GGX14DRAFT_558678 [Mycena pura]
MISRKLRKGASSEAGGAVHLALLTDVFLIRSIINGFAACQQPVFRACVRIRVAPARLCPSASGNAWTEPIAEYQCTFRRLRATEVPPLNSADAVVKPLRVPISVSDPTIAYGTVLMECRDFHTDDSMCLSEANGGPTVQQLNTQLRQANEQITSSRQREAGREAVLGQVERVETERRRVLNTIWESEEVNQYHGIYTVLQREKLAAGNRHEIAHPCPTRVEFRAYAQRAGIPQHLSQLLEFQTHIVAQKPFPLFHP